MIHNDNDQKHLMENADGISAFSSMNDPKSCFEDSSNSINSSKPLAVVKPIVVVKSGVVVSSSNDRTRVNAETSSTIIGQTDETTIITIEQESSSINSDRGSNKKKKSHKNKDSKKKKTTRNKSNERDRSNQNQNSVIKITYLIYFNTVQYVSFSQIRLKQVVHRQKMIDMNKIQKDQIMIIIINLFVIIHLQQLLHLEIIVDHHHMTVIRQVDNQIDRQHRRYIVTFQSKSNTLIVLKYISERYNFIYKKVYVVPC